MQNFDNSDRAGARIEGGKTRGHPLEATGK